jgi:hypothetical protein
MDGMSEQTERKRLADVLAEIESLRPRISGSVATATNRVNELSESLFANAGDFCRAQWCAVAYREGLTKLGILLENNLHFVETLGVLSLTRYIFELLVWFRILARDPEQGIEFYWQVIEKQVSHINDYQAKLYSEIAYFKELDKRDGIPDDALAAIAQDRTAVSADDIARRLHANADILDQEARRRFSLYAEAAKTNGYGFQAFLIETKVLPLAEEGKTQVLAEKAEFEAQIGQPRLDAVINLNGKRKRWNWKERAASVGMSEQYDFIYSYTSRLLHATPVSFYTNQKNLEVIEMLTFLDYVYVSLLDIIELTEKLSDVSGEEETP